MFTVDLADFFCLGSLDEVLVNRLGVSFITTSLSLGVYCYLSGNGIITIETYDSKLVDTIIGIVSMEFYDYLVVLP